VGVLCSPVLPGITDTGKALDGMAKRAKDAGASFFCAQPLFLQPCSKQIYLTFIREQFPALEPMYRQRFDAEAFVSKTYRNRIEGLVKAVCAKYSLERRDGDAMLTRPAGDAGQQALDWTGSSRGSLPFSGNETLAWKKTPHSATPSGPLVTLTHATQVKPL
jgi:hypothetical protein